jgi:nitroreductase
MDVFEAIAARKSVRSYRPDPVPKEVVERIVDAGRQAPSGNNIQPWEFVVVTDAGMRQQLAQICTAGRFIAQAPVCIVVFCRATKYYLEDGSAAIENMLLAATALGLGSCWVAGDKKPYARRIAHMLNVPEEMKLIALISLGYPDDPKPRKPKRPLQEVLHWESF